MPELLLQNGTGVREWKVRSHTYIFVAGCSRTDLLCNVMGWGCRAGQHVHVGWHMQTLTNKLTSYMHSNTHTHTQSTENHRGPRGSFHLVAAGGAAPLLFWLDPGPGHWTEKCVCVLRSLCACIFIFRNKIVTHSIVTVWCIFPFTALHISSLYSCLYTWTLGKRSTKGLEIQQFLEKEEEVTVKLCRHTEAGRGT